MTLLTFFLLTLVLAQPLLAQTGSCTQIGKFTSCHDTTGRQSTIIDMGGGFQSYSDSKGNTGSIIDIGPNFRSFNINPGIPPAPPPPVFSPRLQSPLTPGLPAMPAMPPMPGMPPSPMSPMMPMSPDPYGFR
jgi:hypothetical protein